MNIRKRIYKASGKPVSVYWLADLGRLNGKRTVKQFKSKIEALNFVTLKRREKEQGGVAALNLDDTDRVAMMDAQRRLALLGMTITEAVEFCEQFKHGIEDQRYDQAVVMFLKAKRAANLRERSVKQLESTLGSRFATGRRETLVKDITQDDVETWLNGNGWAPKTRRNYLADLQGFFKFCGRKKWLVHDPAASIEKPNVDDRATAILTAKQAAHLMHTAQETDSGLCAYLGLCLFAGVRPEETRKLTDKHLDLTHGDASIEIPASVSKTRQKRSVDISPNLLEWLNTYDRELPVKNFDRRFKAVRERAGLLKGWENDVMRHSFGTYWVSENRSIGDCAIQMGNSEAIIKKHYLATSTKKKMQAQSKKFWAIVPKKLAAK